MKKKINYGIWGNRFVRLIIIYAVLFVIIGVSINISETRCKKDGCIRTAGKSGFCEQHTPYLNRMINASANGNSSARRTYSFSTIKECLNSDCNNIANDSGYCDKHTKNHSYYTGTCAASGCNREKYCGSYCAEHDICKNKSSCKTANYGGRKICLNSDCGNTAVDEGYCSKHGPNYDPDKCCVIGCNIKKSYGSYCSVHAPKKK